MFSWIPSHSQPWLKVFLVSWALSFWADEQFQLLLFSLRFSYGNDKGPHDQGPGIFSRGRFKQMIYTRDCPKICEELLYLPHGTHNDVLFRLEHINGTTDWREHSGFLFSFSYPKNCYVLCIFIYYFCLDTFTSNKNGASRSIPDFWVLAGKFWKKLKVLLRPKVARL